MRAMNRSASQSTNTSTRARAFVATEAVAITIVAVIFIGILLATTSDSRRLGMLNRDLANMRQIGAWSFAFANDNEDLHPSLTSAPDSIYADIRALATGTPLRQAVGQAIDIIRRRTGRHQFPIPSGWLPHPMFTHLVLADYAQRTLPDVTFVSAGDRHRLNWLDDPINKHDQGFWQPYQNPETGSVAGSHYRWPYSASYQTVPATYDQNQSIWEGNLSRLSQGSSHNSYIVPSVPLGGMKLSDVSFPGQKVLMHDYGAWHFSRQPQYFAHETARVVVLMGDGGASAQATANSNHGWNPVNPSSPSPSIFSYVPRSWEPPSTVSGGGVERVSGYYRWTRGGLKGRDFGGPEIDTGQKY